MNRFTLIELLVVIAMIAILTAMLLPSLNKAREKAQTATCLSNFKTIGQATAMYQGDSDDYFPNGGNVGNLTAEPILEGRWYQKLERYTNNFRVFNCPAMVKVAPGHEVANLKGQGVAGWNPAWGQIPRGRAGVGASCCSALNTSQFGNANSGVPNYTVRTRNLIDQIRTVYKNPRPTLGNVVYVSDGTLAVYSTKFNENYSILQLKYFVHNNQRNILYIDGRAASKGVNDLRGCENDNAAGPMWRVIYSN